MAGGSRSPYARLAQGINQPALRPDPGPQTNPRSASDTLTPSPTMIEQADVDQRERLLDALGDELVGLAGLGNA